MRAVWRSPPGSTRQADLSEVHVGPAQRRGVVHMCGSMKIPRGFLLVVAALFLNVLALRAQNPKLLVPHISWDCGMPGGIPSPESGVLIFEAQMKLARIANIGETPYGERRVAVVQDGALSGTKLSGTVMPGALDLELKLSNGAIEVEQVLRDQDKR